MNVVFRWLTRPSYGGSSGLFPSSKSAGARLIDHSEGRDISMKRTARSKGSGPISIAPLIGKAEPLTSS
jgi:hypothetical protein